MAQDFTIDKVSWHTSVEGNPETPDRVKQRFRIVAEFLQQNGLTHASLLPLNQDPADDFEIRSSDLTEDGLEIMKRGYDKWLKKVVNQNKDITDVRILQKALQEIRGP
jgi:hypothetical protein